MSNKLNRLGTIASAGLLAATVSASATTIDLGFIIDESGSVGRPDYESSITALRNAIAQIPLSDGTTTYRVGVVSFGSTADTVAAPVEFNTAADKDAVLAALLDESSLTDGGTRGYGTPGSITTATNYQAAFDLLTADFGTLGDLSLINMTTDGGVNSGPSNVTTLSDPLKAAGWDSLSFEAVGTGVSSTYLASLGFDTGGQGGCDQIGDASGITDVVDNCFVLSVADYDEYENAILRKVRRTIIDTGGGDPVVPVPAALPLLITGLGVLGFASRRRKG